MMSKRSINIINQSGKYFPSGCVLGAGAWLRPGPRSPHRGRPKGAKAHDGKIITLAPNLMWGTDGTRVFTLDEGWVWVFAGAWINLGI